MLTDRMLEQTEERVEAILEAACKDSQFATRGIVRVTDELEASFGIHVSGVPACGSEAAIRLAMADALTTLAGRILEGTWIGTLLRGRKS